MSHSLMDLDASSLPATRHVRWGVGMESNKGAKANASAFNNDNGPASTTTPEVGSVAHGKPCKPVEVDASVLIKIIKHCNECFPTPVNGFLLGLDQEHSLEVTDCFGLQNEQDLWNQLSREKIDAREVNEKVHLENHRYQVKMLEQLNLVNADCCTVGWYQTLQFNDLKDPNIVEGLCDHQALIREALCIGFDPQLAYLGAEAFKVFRVTDEVLSCRTEAEPKDASAFQRLKGTNVLVEVPLRVRSSLLVQSFLSDWICSNKALQRSGVTVAIDDQDKNVSLNKSLGFILGCLDDLQQEQEKTMKFQKEYLRQYQKQREIAERRRLENEQRRLCNEELLPEIPLTLKRVGEPSHIPTLLMCNQVKRVSNKLNETINDTICRSYLLQKDMSLS